jgi:hypothetical protein
MGYANRSRFDDALSLDAQSGSICLSLAKWRRHSYSYSNSDSNSDGNSDSNGHCYRNCNTWCEVYSHTEATPHATAASLGRRLVVTTAGQSRRYTGRTDP